MMSAATPEPSAIELWAPLALGHDGPWSIFATNGDGERLVHVVETHVELERVASRLAATCNVWVGMGALAERPGPGQRGTAAQIRGISSLWLDIDLAGFGHARSDLPETAQDAERMLATFPLLPTCAVLTGGGLHVYWTLAEELPAAEATPLLDRWGRHWTATAAHFGWHLDPVWDLTRVLRVPGTWNRKGGGARPVSILAALADRAYNPSDIEDNLTEQPAEPSPVRHLASVVGYIGPKRPGDDFAARHTCGEVLAGHGWTLDRTDSNGNQQWRRPGKERRDGTSATVYAADGRCVIWTSSVREVAARESLNPYRLMAKLSYGGDFAAASRDLAARGYGERSDVDLSWLKPRAEPHDDVNPRTVPTEWPDPIPLGDATDLPSFPVDALPAWLADQARAQAEVIQVAVDVPAQLGLVALAAACAKKVKVRIHRGWEEHVNLYVAIALQPSGGKSPAYKAMLGPLQEFEAQLRLDAEERIAELDQQRRILERRMKAKEDSPVPGDDEEARRLRLELAGLERQVMPQLTVGDITQEALVQVLEAQGGRVALIAPEGGVLGMMTGRYNDKASLDEYLLAWGGETIKVDRVGRPSITVPEAVLTVGITVQPYVLEGLGDPALRRRGLTARFMYSIPENLVGQRDYTSLREPDATAGERYRERLTGIAQQMLGYQQPGVLTLSDDARAMFVAFRQWIEDRRGPGGELGSLDEWTGKLEACVVRVAGLLHVAERGATGEIDAATMARSLQIADYWLEHAKAVHDIWGASPEMSAAKSVLRWIGEKRAAEFSVRDAFNGRRKVFERVEDMRGALDILTERLWITPLFEGELVLGKRGVPSQRFAAHPHAVSPKPKPTTERQSVASHAFHASRGISVDISLSPSSSTRKGEPDANAWNAWDATRPDVTPAPTDTEPVDNSIGGGQVDEPPAAPDPIPHPSLAPEELGF